MPNSGINLRAFYTQAQRDSAADLRFGARFLHGAAAGKVYMKKENRLFA
jgi:hypothetical protein